MGGESLTLVAGEGIHHRDTEGAEGERVVENRLRLRPPAKRWHPAEE